MNNVLGLIPLLAFCVGAAVGAVTIVLTEWQWRRKHKFHLTCPQCGDEDEIPYRDWEATMLRVVRFVGVHTHCRHMSRELQ